MREQTIIMLIRSVLLQQIAGCPTHSRVSNEWASGITRLRVFHHRPHIYPTTNLRV